MNFDEKYPLSPLGPCTQPRPAFGFEILPEPIPRGRYRCSACQVKYLKKLLKKRCLVLNVGGWTNVYVLGEIAAEGQDCPRFHNGEHIRFIVGFRRLAHSFDEDCAEEITNESIGSLD